MAAFAGRTLDPRVLLVHERPQRDAHRDRGSGEAVDLDEADDVPTPPADDHPRDLATGEGRRPVHRQEALVAKVDGDGPADALDRGEGVGGAGGAAEDVSDRDDGENGRAA
ncbi:MAG: hypothetical protein E6G08_19015 [Actinobacteria bacterium]|nr:MAG: hypothetical protein E6G15_07900 [Actinomycetota bacterium]TML83803.1 MAG: hypothetical protein E6G08_19015 [Actinomycetota bacterium]